MTMLKVKKRSGFPFQDTRLVGGAEIDTRQFPRVGEHKWAQLLDQGYFELVDKPGRDITRALAERDRARQTLANTAETSVVLTPTGAVEEPIVETPIVVTTEPIACGDCGFTAKTPHGLKVHVGRRHKE